MSGWNINLKITDDISFDITKEFEKINKQFTNPTTLITSIWNQQIIDDFNDFIEKIITSISNNLIDRNNFYSLMAELNSNNDFIDNFLQNLNINVLKSGIDDELYYSILKLKYTDLWFFLEQFWSKVLKKTNNLENIDDIDKENKKDDFFSIDKYKKIDEYKLTYNKLLSLLKNNIDEFKKQLREFRVVLLEKYEKELWFKKINNEEIENELSWNDKGKKKILEKLEDAKFSPAYQILRYIWLKNKEFRANVLDNILRLTENDLQAIKVPYSKYLKILFKLQSIILPEEEVKDLENTLKKEKILKLKKLNIEQLWSKAYFEIEKEIEPNKKTDYWKYIKNYFIGKYKLLAWQWLDLDNLYEFYNLDSYLKKANIFDYWVFQKKLLDLSSTEEKDNNLQQKFDTLKIYEKLFMIKNIILHIEDKLWYSPWIKVFIKQWLAEKIDFNSEKLKRLEYILYFVLAQNYSEYKVLYKFFNEIRNIYQKENIWKKIVNTVSIFVLWALFYLVLYFYLDSEIYKTLFFIIVFINTFILWYFKKFNFDFKNLSVNGKIVIWWWFVICALILLLAGWIYGLNIFVGVCWFLIMFFLYALISMIWWKYFNSWVYKISLFLFIVMFIIWLWKSNNQESVFIKKWQEITSTVLWKNIAQTLFNVNEKEKFLKDNIIKVLVLDRNKNNKSLSTDIIKK